MDLRNKLQRVIEDTIYIYIYIYIYILNIYIYTYIYLGKDTWDLRNKLHRVIEDTKLLCADTRTALTSLNSLANGGYQVFFFLFLLFVLGNYCAPTRQRTKQFVLPLNSLANGGYQVFFFFFPFF